MFSLSIQNVSKQYANHLAVDNVSIDVPVQSIFGLLGPNGAGKTSLIRIVTQIIAPDKGTISINGEPLKHQHIYNIGYLPEERGLYKKMEVGSVVLYLAQLKGLSKNEAMQRIKKWFVKFEMQSWWNKKVEELSKGMQQKVQFVTTVLHNPKLIILDEPFTGFDPINADIIKHEILNLRDEGATIMLSTHRMESVEELCDSIALINKSKKILDGKVNDIKKAYKSNIYEIEYTGTLPAFSENQTGFEVIGSSNGELSKIRIKILQPNLRNQLLQTIMPHVQIHSFKEIIPSMSDVFIKAVKSE